MNDITTFWPIDEVMKRTNQSIRKGAVGRRQSTRGCAAATLFRLGVPKTGKPTAARGVVRAMAFTDLTDKFPAGDFPLALGELTYRAFQEKAHLLPDALVAEYVAPLEPEVDEYTEVLPVAKYKRTGFTALVYWKAGLLHNHYRLATFDPTGNPVDNRVIAGSYVAGDEVTHSAATVTEGLVVYVVSGQENLGDDLGTAATNSAIRLGLDDGGVIEELTAAEEEDAEA